MKFEYIAKTSDKAASDAAINEWLMAVKGDENADGFFDCTEDATDNEAIKVEFMGSDNGCQSFYRHMASNGLALWFFYDGSLGLSVEEGGMTLSGMVERFDAPDGSDMHELREAWGLDPELHEAEDGEDKVKVWIEWNYYHGTLGSPSNGWARDDDNDIIIFNTFDAAQEWIDERESGTYYLSHGEAGEPTYTICN